MPEYLCPHCKNPIFDDEALLCHFCGESLRRGTGFMGKIKYSKPKIIIIAVVLLVLVSFLFMMVK